SARPRDVVERFFIEKNLSCRISYAQFHFTGAFVQASRSPWQELIDLWIDALRELHGAGLGGLFSVSCGSPDANHRSVGWSVLQTIGNQQELFPVFTRDDPSM